MLSNISWHAVTETCKLVNGLADVEFERMAGLYRTTLLLDVDNTLVRVDRELVRPEIIELLSTARQQGFIEQIALISNVAIPLPDKWRRVQFVAEQLRAEACICAYWPFIKPSIWPYKLAMHRLKVEPENCFMVGDQLLSDIRGAHRLGIPGFLVRPLGPDNRITWRKRRREQDILRSLELSFPPRKE